MRAHVPAAKASAITPVMRAPSANERPKSIGVGTCRPPPPPVTVRHSKIIFCVTMPKPSVAIAR